MGMTYEQYWDGDPYLAKVYRKAHRLRKKAENELAWLQGLYVFGAVAACFDNAFAKKGAKPKPYFERPLDIYPLTAEEKKEREREEIRKAEEAMKAMIRKQRQKKAKGEN